MLDETTTSKAPSPRADRPPANVRPSTEAENSASPPDASSLPAKKRGTAENAAKDRLPVKLRDELATLEGRLSPYASAARLWDQFNNAERQGLGESLDAAYWPDGGAKVGTV